MKSKLHSLNGAVFFFLLTLLVAFFSWIGSVYGGNEVQSLLSAEGIRWSLGHIVENYVQTPALGIVLILLMGIGVGVRAGFYDALKRLCRKERLLSRKERRALMLASVTLLLYVIVIVGAFLLPWNFLLGVTGDLFPSPFAKGAVYIISLGIGVSGMVYGSVVDAFRTLSDVVNGMSILIARKAYYFVTLFFVVQFFSSLAYSGLAEWAHIPDEVVKILFYLSCYLPLLV